MSSWGKILHIVRTACLVALYSHVHLILHYTVVKSHDFPCCQWWKSYCQIMYIHSPEILWFSKKTKRLCCLDFKISVHVHSLCTFSCVFECKIHKKSCPKTSVYPQYVPPLKYMYNSRGVISKLFDEKESYSCFIFHINVQGTDVRIL